MKAFSSTNFDCVSFKKNPMPKLCQPHNSNFKSLKIILKRSIALTNLIILANMVFRLKSV